MIERAYHDAIQWLQSPEALAIYIGVGFLVALLSYGHAARLARIDPRAHVGAVGRHMMIALPRMALFGAAWPLYGLYLFFTNEV